MPKASRKSESEPVKEIKKAKKDASIPTLVVKPKEVCKVIAVNKMYNASN